MEANCTLVSYAQTGYFSKLVIDYLQQNEKLQSFYKHPVSLEGIKAAIHARQQFPQQREVLAQELKKQYEGLPHTSKLDSNIEQLLQPGTFTITTAHQPNIFTGPLYFIYKILHTIKLSDTLKQQLPDYNFVPVYYMGSEDADLDELGSITIDEIKYTWQTKQTGAVGRMKVDKAFISLMGSMHGQLGVLPFGAEIMELFTTVYTTGKTIQQATLELINHLFGEYGLVVVIPDNAALKKLFHSVVEKELTEQFSHKAVQPTLYALDQLYKVQAGGRELNLFYLIDDKRQRIEIKDSVFKVDGLEISFTQEEILVELKEHPERFSANVILRGVFQETILPDIAFIGGGGELAYWLELKNVFEAVNVPYPMLVLRNSFLLAEDKWKQKTEAIGLHLQNLFLSEHELMNKVVAQQSNNHFSLNGELKKVEDLYDQMSLTAANVDTTLQNHVAALKVKAIKRLQELEKKMLRAEKRKFETERNQLHKIKTALFPNNGLQERVENLSGIYGRYGKEIINIFFLHSLSLEQQFAIVTIK
ncbi:MAG: bacillithiol biosynthesis cysteine-adding enzyme BshC [Panacibacter sp.]